MSIVCLNLYDEIRAERFAQDQKWGGSKHDDTHSDGDWLGYIQQHLWRAHNEADAYRKQMVRVAALVVAAIESYDRENSQPSKGPQPAQAREGGLRAETYFERDRQWCEALFNEEGLGVHTNPVGGKAILDNMVKVSQSRLAAERLDEHVKTCEKCKGSAQRICRRFKELAALSKAAEGQK